MGWCIAVVWKQRLGAMIWVQLTMQPAIYTMEISQLPNKLLQEL